MNFKNALVGLSVAVFTLSVAVAAPKKKASKSTKKPAHAAAIKETPSVEVPAGKEVAPAADLPPLLDSASSATSSGGQSVTTISVAKPATKKFGGALTSHNEYLTETVNTGGPARGNSASTELWVRLGYQLSEDVALGLGEDFNHNAFGANKEGSVRPFEPGTDPFASVTIPKTAVLPGDVALSTSVRAYAPVSEASKEQGLVTELRGYGTLSKEIGRLTLSLNTNPRAYVQSKSWYQKSAYKESPKATPTRAFRILNYVEGSYKLSDSVNVAQNFGLDEIFANPANIQGVNVQGDSNTFLLAETRVEWSINPNFGLAGGVTTYERDLRSSAFTIYGEDSRYFFDATAKF